MTENHRVIAGRYEVGNLIGRGGMADVYEGVDTRLGRVVAIKLLKSDLANDPTFESRFKQEAQASARMAHPTIVRVYDAGEEISTDENGTEHRRPFIIMEYVRGTLLRDLMHQRSLTIQETIDYAEGVLTALEFSHRAGVIHRDIKSSNIMITDAGLVKVMDFGIARAISDSSATQAHTSGIVGTAQYFSPEQARGETVDARTDLYSTGVLLYEMLAGRPPFTGDTAVSVAYQHVSEAVTPPSAHNSLIGGELDQVVLHALAKDRNERFQSAEEFREHLLAAYSGSPITTKAATPLETIEAPAEPAAPVAPVAPEVPAANVTDVIADEAQDPMDDFEALLRDSGLEATTVIKTPAPEVVEAASTVDLAKPATPATPAEPAEPQTNPFESLGVEFPVETASNTVVRARNGNGRPAANILWGIGSGIGVLLVGFLIWILAASPFNFQWGINPGQTGVTVSNVVGSNYQSGYDTLVAQKLLVNRVYQQSDTVPADIIISTDPAAGTVVQERTTITVYVSLGKNKVRIPNLKGMTEEQATAALVAAKLSLGTITQSNSPTVPAGQVISSDPEINTDVAEGTVINLVISNGLVSVPDLTNYGISEAEALLTGTELGLEVSIETQGECLGSQGTIVISQSVVGQAEQGSTVVLYVSCEP